MAAGPRRASADPPRLPAAGSQSGRRGRPGPQIKSVRPRAAPQSREWEKSGASERHTGLLSSPHLALEACPPCRLLAVQVSTPPARGLEVVRAAPAAPRTRTVDPAARGSPLHLPPLRCSSAPAPSACFRRPRLPEALGWRLWGALIARLGGGRGVVLIFLSLLAALSAAPGGRSARRTVESLLGPSAPSSAVLCALRMEWLGGPAGWPHGSLALLLRGGGPWGTVVVWRISRRLH